MSSASDARSDSGRGTPPTLSEYQHIIRPVRRVLAEQRLALDHFLEDMGDYAIRLIEERTKPYLSVVGRIRDGRYKSVLDFPDLAAMRIVVHSQADSELIVAFFERQAQRKDLEIMKNKSVVNEGYRARHLILKIAPSYRRSGHEVVMEVQIRTLAEDVYNSISRAYWYKYDKAKPSEALRETLTQHLLEADKMVSEIRDTAEAAIARNGDRSVTPFSYRALVSEYLEQDISILEAVDQIFVIRDRGDLTNGRIQEIFTDQKVKARVKALVEDTDGFLKDDHSWYLVVHALSDSDFETMKNFYFNYSLK